MKRKTLLASGLLFFLVVSVAAYGLTLRTAPSDSADAAAAAAEAEGKACCAESDTAVTKGEGKACCAKEAASSECCADKSECPLSDKAACEEKCPLEEGQEVAFKAEGDVPACCQDKE